MNTEVRCGHRSHAGTAHCAKQSCYNFYARCPNWPHTTAIKEMQDADVLAGS